MMQEIFSSGSIPLFPTSGRVGKEYFLVCYKIYKGDKHFLCVPIFPGRFVISKRREQIFFPTSGKGGKDIFPRTSGTNLLPDVGNKPCFPTSGTNLLPDVGNKHCFPTSGTNLLPDVGKGREGCICLQIQKQMIFPTFLKTLLPDVGKVGKDKFPQTSGTNLLPDVGNKLASRQ